MLLAVEGGGFFSSSASGYSKGLTLLLLGQRNEEKPMRVAPWNQYQLVDQESDPDPDIQLASSKNRLVRGCASFVCFGRAAAGLENPSPPKVGPAQQQEDDRDKSADSEIAKDTCSLDPVDDGNVYSTNVGSLRSSLKQPAATSDPVTVVVNNVSESDPVNQNGSDGPGHTERRKVKWTDVTGGELFEIREFEPSEHSGSDDEFENGSERTCSCRIM